MRPKPEGVCINMVILKLPFELFMKQNDTEGFLTAESFHSTSLTNWGSNWVPKEAKFIKEFDFIGFSRCFSVRIE